MGIGPYERTEGGTVGADCISAHAAAPDAPSPAAHTVGADAHIGPQTVRLSKNLAEDVCDRAAGNVCKGLRPLARSINTYF